MSGSLSKRNANRLARLLSACPGARQPGAGSIECAGNRRPRSRGRLQMSGEISRMTATASARGARLSFGRIVAAGALALLGFAAAPTSRPAMAAELEHTSMAQTPAIMAFLAAYIAEDAGI